MKNRDLDVVSASEIASWAWHPESWRLSSLGREPSNRGAMACGERRHADRAAFEELSRSAISVGWWLVVSGVVLVLTVAFFLAARG